MSFAIFELLFAATLWVGHACIWTTLLNVFYSQYWPKHFLKPWRIFTGLLIAGFPIALYFGYRSERYEFTWIDELWAPYVWFCLFLGVFVFPLVTLLRYTRDNPRCVLEQRTETIDLWKRLGPGARGNGKWRWLTYLPGSCVFKFDVTELTLKLPRLPAKLDGLSILFLSDLHFHGTPSKLWFDAIIDRLLQFPKPDIVALGGDCVDCDEHRAWIASILGRLEWNGVGVAILGNHDAYHDPESVRVELSKCGFAMIGAESKEVTIRGERCVFSGNEVPWFPAPAAPPPGGFRICVSHSPDRFPWAQRQGFDLVLAGHVHGGQVRVPIIESIFVPSIYGRRYDMGVFEKNGTVLVVSRGLSGKEPLRFRCNPQVIRMVLRCGSSEPEA